MEARQCSSVLSGLIFALLLLLSTAPVDANLHLRNFTEADILKCQKGQTEPPPAQRLTITGLPFSGHVLLQVRVTLKD